MFGAIVTESVQLIKESLLSVDNHEEDILSYKNAYQDLELLIQNVLSSFAFTLENAAIEDYRNGASNIPSDSVRLVSFAYLKCQNDYDRQFCVADLHQQLSVHSKQHLTKDPESFSRHQGTVFGETNL